MFRFLFGRWNAFSSMRFFLSFVRLCVRVRCCCCVLRFIFYKFHSTDWLTDWWCTFTFLGPACCCAAQRILRFDQFMWRTNDMKIYVFFFSFSIPFGFTRLHRLNASILMCAFALRVWKDKNHLLIKITRMHVISFVEFFSVPSNNGL